MAAALSQQSLTLEWSKTLTYKYPAIAVSNNGEVVVVGLKGDVEVYNGQGSLIFSDSYGEDEGDSISAAISNDGRVFALLVQLGTNNSKLYIYSYNSDTGSYTRIDSIPLNNGEVARSVALPSNEPEVVVASTYKSGLDAQYRATLYVYNITSHTIRNVSFDDSIAYMVTVSDNKISGGGFIVAMAMGLGAGEDGGGVAIYRYANDQLRQVSVVEQGYEVKSVSVTENGKYLTILKRPDELLTSSYYLVVYEVSEGSAVDIINYKLTDLNSKTYYMHDAQPAVLDGEINIAFASSSGLEVYSVNLDQPNVNSVGNVNTVDETLVDISKYGSYASAGGSLSGSSHKIILYDIKNNQGSTYDLDNVYDLDLSEDGSTLVVAQTDNPSGASTLYYYATGLQETPPPIAESGFLVIVAIVLAVIFFMKIFNN